MKHPGRIGLRVRDGFVLIGGDCHYWPGKPSFMHRAFVTFCKDIKPKIVILNGDVIDAPQISKHARIGWDKQPKLAAEIAFAKERLSEIETAAKGAPKVWTLGNHDQRFETFLAARVPEYQGVPGMSLSYHFPAWKPCWAVFINNNIVVKHRLKGGKHAAYNNVLASGLTMITGHLHNPSVRGVTDYRGTRYAVDHGMIADPNHRAFLDYTEDGPKDWREAFCVLEFTKGRMKPPELVERWDNNNVIWRGQVIRA